MAILNVKIRMEAGYDAAESSWTVISGNGDHINTGDILNAEPSEKWKDAPKQLKVIDMREDGTFVTDTNPVWEDNAGEEPVQIKIVMEKVYELKDPQTMQWDSADMEADGCSGTNQLGKYFRDVIDKKVTVGASWGPLENQEISKLLYAIKDDMFFLEYPDAYMGEKRTMEAYINSRTAPMYRYVAAEDERPADWMWQGLSISFMEV